MSRRIVPGTFWVGFLACALLVLAGTLRAAGPSHRPPDMTGVWDGFFLAADGTTGLVRSEVTQQIRRRIAGAGMLLDLEGRAQFNAYNFRFSATVPQDDFVTGTGVAGKGRLVFQADVATFTGLGGNAGVMAPEYHFVPSRGGAGRISALLLHPYPGVATDISGNGEGPFVSLPDPITGDFPDPSFAGIARMQIAPRSARGSFAGRVEFFLDPAQPPVISWPFLATTSDDRRVLWIAQGASGRIIYEGVVVPAPDDESGFSMNGVFRLFLNDGQSLFNAYNFNLSRIR
jgi:hypothetical protein